MKAYALDEEMEEDEWTDESLATVVVTSTHHRFEGKGFDGGEVFTMSLTAAIAYCKGFWHGVNMAPEGDNLGTFICLTDDDDSLGDFYEVGDPEIIELVKYETALADKRQYMTYVQGVLNGEKLAPNYSPKHCAERLRSYVNSGCVLEKKEKGVIDLLENMENW